MTYEKQGQEYIIDHGYFRVIDFAQIPGENRYKIHIQNQDYDTVVVPYIDTKETLEVGSTIKMAYIIENGNVVCHGYEVTEPRPELDWSVLPPHKNIRLKEEEVNVQVYKNILVNYINQIMNSEIRRFVINILEKKSSMFFIWPAATNVHHNYRSGLLQHTVNVVRTAVNLAYIYSDIDLDLLIAGSVLHDIGKIYEYSEDGSVSGEGVLFDHINIGTRIIFEEYYHGEDSVYSFPEKDLQHLSHILLSHHGKLEWGSSRTPATKEAMIVHYADYIDSNMFTIHRELSNLELGQSAKSKYVGQVVQTKISTAPTYDKV